MEPGPRCGYPGHSLQAAPTGRPLRSLSSNRDCALNSIAATVAPSAATPSSSSTSPRLDAFVSAAATGRLLWATPVEAGRLQVCGGATPDRAATDEIGRLFVSALRDCFGDAAAAIAEREWGLSAAPRRLLPARTVRCAVACAESALSLLMAQTQLLQFEFSARLIGWRFRLVAQGLQLVPGALSAEFRQALDEALAVDFQMPPTDPERVAARLRTLLTNGLH